VYVGIASSKLLVFTAKNNFISEKPPDNQQKTTRNCNIVATFVFHRSKFSLHMQLGLFTRGNISQNHLTLQFQPIFSNKHQKPMGLLLFPRAKLPVKVFLEQKKPTHLSYIFPLSNRFKTTHGCFQK